MQAQTVKQAANLYHSQLQGILAAFDRDGMNASTALAYAQWSRNWEAVSALLGVFPLDQLKEKQRVWAVAPAGAPNSIARAFQTFMIAL